MYSTNALFRLQCMSNQTNVLNIEYEFSSHAKEVRIHEARHEAASQESEYTFSPLNRTQKEGHGTANQHTKHIANEYPTVTASRAHQSIRRDERPSILEVTPKSCLEFCH